MVNQGTDIIVTEGTIVVQAAASWVTALAGCDRVRRSGVGWSSLS